MYFPPCNFIVLLTVLWLYGSNCENDDKILCPNYLKPVELRDEFAFIVHLIEKKYVGQENGWRKFAKFLTFLTPKKRMETIDEFCAKMNRESDQQKSQWFFRKMKPPVNKNEQCLNKIFWQSNAELAKLKGANFLGNSSKYNEVAKMLESMLKPRAQLVAEILHNTLTKKDRAKIEEKFDVLAEVLFGRPKHELIRVIIDYNERFNDGQPKAAQSQTLLLSDIQHKFDQLVKQKYDFKILVERVNAIHNERSIDEKRLNANILEECKNWKCVGSDCTHVEEQQQHLTWSENEIVLQMSKMNRMLKKLLIFFDYNSSNATNFAENFKPNCADYIKYMQNSSKPQAAKSYMMPNKNAWFRRFKKDKQTNTQNTGTVSLAQQEIVSRNNFFQIWKLLGISGLLEIGSEYVHLAKTLNEANLRGNFETVSRIIGIHVGKDMLKILAKLNDNSAKSKFNGMFQVAYMEILKDTQDNCYQLVESENGTHFGQNEKIVQPVQHSSEQSREIKFENTNHKKDSLQFAKQVNFQQKSRTILINNNAPSKNVQKIAKNSIQKSPLHSSETEDEFYSPENFEIYETENLSNINDKSSTKSVQSSKNLEEIQSEIEEEFHSPEFVAEPENSNAVQENGINYLRLFKEFTSSFLNDDNGEMHGNWKKLIASFKATDRFLLFLTETVKEKILKRKWKILGPKKRCNPLENKQFANFLSTKADKFDRRILNIQSKWIQTMPNINMNFFKSIVLFGINLADHRLSKMGEKDRNDRRAKKKMLKMKTTLSNAFHCFPSMQMDLGDNRDVQEVLHYVMALVALVTKHSTETKKNYVHIYQLVERNGKLYIDDDDHLDERT